MPRDVAEVAAQLLGLRELLGPVNVLELLPDAEALGDRVPAFWVSWSFGPSPRTQRASIAVWRWTSSSVRSISAGRP